MKHNVRTGFLICPTQDIDLRGDHYIGASLLEKINGVHPIKRGDPNEGSNPWRGDVIPN